MKHKKVTDREKAVIFWAVVTGQKNMTEIFKLTRDDLGRGLKSPGASADKWKRLQEIETEFINAGLILEDIKKKAAEDGVKLYLSKVQELKKRKTENGTDNGGNSETELINPDNISNLVTDFTDRKQFLEYLNRQANTITDDKQRNDILKMLSDLLRFKEDKPDQAGEIQRFYIPMTCKQCELYKRETVKDSDS